MKQSGLLFRFLEGLVLVLLLQNVSGQVAWNGIVPYVTTRAEVEKKLGKPTRGSFYDLPEGKVLVKYVETSCDKKTECRCLAPLGTVQFIDVNLGYDLFLENLTIDRSAFRRKVNNTDPTMETLSDPKSGVVYELDDGKVTHIYYYESEATCKSFLSRISASNNSCFSTTQK